MTRLIQIFDDTLTALLDWAERAPWRGALLVAVLALAVIVPGQATMPVTDRDEGRFVQATKQMLETGDLVDIRFQDQPRWKKPAGIYWLQAGSASLLDGGSTAAIWAYRVPSALAGLAVALLTLWAARPLTGPRGAVVAGAMMALSLLLVVEAHIAKTDAALAMTAIAALGALARMVTAAREGREAGPGLALVFWLAIAASILLKGPIVPTIAILALLWLWLVGRVRPPWDRLQPLRGVILTLVLVAPWLIAIWIISDGAFFQESLGRDMGAKVVSGQEKHWGPPGLYAGIVWLTLWPWAALIPMAAGWWWRHRKEMWLVLLAGWVLPFWLILEAVPTKLPHYVLPLYPALVIALAAWICKSAEQPRRWTQWAAAGLVAVPAVLLALALIALPLVLEGTVVLAAIPLAAIGGGAAILSARAALAGRLAAQLAGAAVAALALYPAAFQFSLPSIATAFPSPRMAAVLAQYEPCASGPAFSVGYHEPSLVFLTRTDIRMADPPGAMAALAEDPGAMVLIEGRWQQVLDGSIPPSVVRAEISYFNYNRGKSETAQLLTPDHPRWDACLD
ncbi:MAG: glycosyltransferase family 39 protein [Pseudomonadota bacterium]